MDASPHAQRQWQRTQQRKAKLAYNSINAAHKAWQDAISRGRQAAIELTNAYLSCSHMRRLQLGTLADLPGLVPAARAKLTAQAATHLEAVRDALCTLGDSAASLREAADSLAVGAGSGGISISSNDNGSGVSEASESMLARRPLFAAMSAQQIASEADKLARAYEDELVLKSRVVTAFGEMVAGIGTAGTMSPTSATAAAAAAVGNTGHRARQAAACPGAGGGGGGGGGAGPYTDAAEAQLQMLICAWMLGVAVREDDGAEFLASLRADMEGF